MTLSLDDIANRDETKTIAVVLTLRDGTKRSTPVTYRPNALTMEPVEISDDEVLLYDPEDPDDEDVDLDDLDDDEIERRAAHRNSFRNAKALCQMIAEWEIAGPLYDRAGRELVPRGEVVPLEPRCVRCVPTWITSQISRQVSEHEFPKPKESKRSRGR